MILIVLIKILTMSNRISAGDFNILINFSQLLLIIIQKISKYHLTKFKIKIISIRQTFIYSHIIWNEMRLITKLILKNEHSPYPFISAPKYHRINKLHIITYHITLRHIYASSS